MLQRVFCFDRAIREHPTTLEALSVVPASISSAVKEIVLFSLESSLNFSGNLISFIICSILSVICKFYRIICTIVISRVLYQGIVHFLFLSLSLYPDCCLKVHYFLHVKYLLIKESTQSHSPWVAASHNDPCHHLVDQSFIA